MRKQSTSLRRKHLLLRLAEGAFIVNDKGTPSVVFGSKRVKVRASDITYLQNNNLVDQLNNTYTISNMGRLKVQEVKNAFCVAFFGA